MRRRLFEGNLRLHHRSHRGLLLFSGDVSLKFELPQVAKQRSNLQREAISFSLQRAHPIVDPARHRVGGVSVLGGGYVRRVRGVRRVR